MLAGGCDCRRGCSGSTASSRLLPYALLSLLVLWPLRWLAWGRLSARTPLDLPLAGLVVMASVSLVISALPAKTFPQVLSLLLGMAAFYALVNWLRSASRLRFMQVAMVLFLLLLSVIGVAGVGVNNEGVGKLPFIPQQIYTYVPHLLQDAINPNVLAGNLAFLLPFAMCALIFPSVKPQPWLRFLALLVVGITTAVSALTQSRNAFILAFLLRWPKQWYLLLVPPLLSRNAKCPAEAAGDCAKRNFRFYGLKHRRDNRHIDEMYQI